MNNNKALEEIAISFLQSCKKDLDAYTSQKGEIETLSGGNPGAVMYTPQYVQFARYGRGPGKNPPFENILDFVKSRKISFGDLTENQTAWVIAFKIGREGTKNFVPNAPNFISEVLALYEQDLISAIGDFTASVVMKENQLNPPFIFPTRIRL